MKKSTPFLLKLINSYGNVGISAIKGMKNKKTAEAVDAIEQITQELYSDCVGVILLLPQ